MINVKFSCIIYIFFLFTNRFTLHSDQQNAIVGRWISSQENVIVLIYKDDETFKGKIVWFDDSDDKSNPMDSRTDSNNPVKSLRNQKIIGLEVLNGLTYNIKCNCWQNGKIYDIRTGRTWSSSITLENENQVKVRGFWHYEFIGKSMTFRRLE